MDAGELLKRTPVVVRRGPYALGVWDELPAGFVFAMRDDRESTALVREERLDALPPPRTVQRGWSILTLDLEMGWDIVGVLAIVSSVLAAARVPIGAFSAFSRDHIIVPATRLDDALRALEGACGPVRLLADDF